MQIFYQITKLIAYISMKLKEKRQQQKFETKQCAIIDTNEKHIYSAWMKFGAYLTICQACLPVWRGAKFKWLCHLPNYFICICFVPFFDSTRAIIIINIQQKQFIGFCGITNASHETKWTKNVTKLGNRSLVQVSDFKQSET